jgi:GntR family transcriptional regulator, transcriptional repressor for pyruvate dehydrogenase complex
VTSRTGATTSRTTTTETASRATPLLGSSALPAAVRESWRSSASDVGELKSDRIVRLLERQILGGSLPAGTMLPAEAELCDSLGVSRSVLRDAIRTLATRGLVEVSRGRGTVIAAPSDEQFGQALTALLARAGVSMGEVMHAREMIESMVAGLAAEAATASDVALLEAAYERLAVAVGQSDHAGAAQSHAEFHLAILDAAHQPALAVILAPVSRLATLTGVASVRAVSIEDYEVETHRPIVDAIARAERAAAEEATRAHFVTTARSSDYAAHYASFLSQPFASAFLGQGGVK